jgi:AraC-like DNA-binding protein
VQDGANPEGSVRTAIIGGYVAAIIEAAVAQGAPLDALLHAGGLKATPENAPMVRISSADFRRLLSAATTLTRNPYFSLHAADYVHATDFHALGLALLASEDARDFCLRFARYFRFLAGATAPALTESGDEARLQFTTLMRPALAHHDTVGLFLLRTLRELSGGRVFPTRVELAQAPPPDGGQQHARAFGCEVRFDAPHSILYFSRASLSIPFHGASRELAEHNEGIVVRYLARLDRNDIVTRVRDVLIQGLPTGAATKDAVAGKLAMSPRTLQVKLSRQGTSFQAIVDETRFALACGYLDSGSMSITEIAYLLGFSDTSNFSRAFRRWCGVSPREHRAHVDVAFDGGSPAATPIVSDARRKSAARRSR